MSIQKIHPSKDNYDEFAINFNEEPKKSLKQLSKLLKMASKHILTKSEFAKLNNGKAEEEEEKS